LQALPVDIPDRIVPQDDAFDAQVHELMAIVRATLGDRWTPWLQEWCTLQRMQVYLHGRQGNVKAAWLQCNPGGEDFVVSIVFHDMLVIEHLKGSLNQPEQVTKNCQVRI